MSRADNRRRLIALLSAPVIALALVPPASYAAPVAQGPAPAVTAAPARDTDDTLRVATYNVRTARARGDKRNWLARVGDVSREILDRRPAVVMLQELGPGRADGKKAKIKNSARQTDSLTTRLARTGGKQYRLVRVTSYVKPGTKHGTQGARILYDSSRLTLLSNCPETTGKKNWNPSCAFDLPVAAGDSKKKLRSAAYAKFRDQNTGQAFWVVSTHFDNRHGSKAKDAKMSRLRVAQAAKVVSMMNKLNTTGLPVVFGADINSWESDRSNYAPHRYLVSKGYADTVSAATRVNLGYPTVNHWKSTLKKSKRGNGVRLDVVMVQGDARFTRWENKMALRDSTRSSDHNMVLADLRF
jgi:endonuclease/exonuclease/phosphatase family metal-dependent hydrolase